jgi:hypothetical protein
MRQGTLRNVLVVLGGVYLSTWISVPLWPSILRLTTDRVYHPGWESVRIIALQLIPPVGGAVIAGAVVGVALQTDRVGRWALVLAALIAVLRWLSVRWHVSPELSDRARQAATALIPAAVGGIALCLGARWQRRQHDGEPHEPGA